MGEREVVDEQPGSPSDAAGATSTPAASAPLAEALRRGRPLLDRFVVGVLIGCTVLYGVFIWRPSFEYGGRRWFTLFDDAMISMTYARNLADGHGLVWNVGGPAVEGYTNPLWTLVMAGAHRLGLSEPLVPLAISVIAAVLLLGCIVLAAALARRLAPASRFAPGAAALLVGLCYPLVYWSLRGMEVGLVTFLVLAGILLALRLRDRVRARDVVALCAVVAAGLLTRDDFLVPSAVLGAWLLWQLRGRARAVVAGALVATGLVVVGGQVGFRLAYYGEPLPNTYYLKVAGQPVAPRLSRGLLTLVAVVLADLVVLLGVLAVGLRAGKQRISAAAVLLLAMAAALGAYSIYVGGDAWEWARLANRYLTPAVVVLLVLVASVLEPVAERIRRSRRPVFALTLVLVLALLCGVVDSWIGVLLSGVLGDYLGFIDTDPSRAALAALVLVVALVVAWLVGGRRRLPRGLARPVVLVPILAVAVLLATTGSAWRSWAGDAGFYTEQNKGATAYGLELGRLTEPGATIAVIWAGAPIYYAHRDGVDLLGKMDPVIAHGPHHEGIAMYPGHDKFDFDHSIGDLRPDLIAQYAWFTDADIDHFLAEGYEPMRFRPGVAPELAALDVHRALLWVRADSTKVHRELLEPVPVEEARRIAVEPR